MSWPRARPSDTGDTRRRVERRVWWSVLIIMLVPLTTAALLLGIAVLALYAMAWWLP